jgi:hypothetical protein
MKKKRARKKQKIRARKEKERVFAVFPTSAAFKYTGAAQQSCPGSPAL